MHKKKRVWFSLCGWELECGVFVPKGFLNFTIQNIWNKKLMVIYLLYGVMLFSFSCSSSSNIEFNVSQISVLSLILQFHVQHPLMFLHFE